MHRVGLLLAWLLGACSTPAPTAVRPSAPTAVGPQAVAERPVDRFASTAPRLLDQRLDDHAVTSHDFVRLDLYTWTSPEQIEALRAGGKLLVANAATAGHATPYNRLLEVMVAERREGHELAAILRQNPQLNHMRYAWPSPLATVLGKGPRRYGEALIRVQLDPRGVIARLDPTGPHTWSFRDGAGRDVEVRDILAEPTRLAAIYHVRVHEDDGTPFREYVLCNERWVQRWSVGTPAIAARVAAERQLVLDLATGPFSAEGSTGSRWRAWPQWKDDAPAPTLASRWHRILAFDNPRYRPTPDALAAVVNALDDYDPTPPAMRGGPAHASSR